MQKEHNLFLIFPSLRGVCFLKVYRGTCITEYRLIFLLLFTYKRAGEKYECIKLAIMHPLLQMFWYYLRLIALFYKLILGSGFTPKLEHVFISYEYQNYSLFQHFIFFLKNILIDLKLLLSCSFGNIIQRSKFLIPGIIASRYACQ